MKRISLFLLLSIMSFQVISQNLAIEPLRYIIKSNKSISQNEIENLVSIDNNYYKFYPIFEELNLYMIEIYGKNEEIIKTLEDCNIIEYVSKDKKIEYRYEPNDEYYPEQYNMAQIKMPDVWEISTGGLTYTGDTIVVAILDRDFDVTHEDLRNNIWRNLDEIPNDGIDNDNNGYIDDVYGANIQGKNGNHKGGTHGTAVGGIIGASSNNNVGVTGINWNIKMLPLTGTGSVSMVISAYNYVYKLRKKYNESNGQEGAFIVSTNFSAGISNHFPEDAQIYLEWCNIYDKLGEEGILSVSASDNNPRDVGVLGDMPTLCTSQYLITVTSNDENDKFDDRRSYNSTHVDLSAPGKNVTSTKSDGYRHNNFDGNSGAAPHVAGAIAILYSLPCEGFMAKIKENPDSCIIIKNAILENVDRQPELQDKTYSGGRLNVYNSFSKLIERYCGIIVSELDISKIYPNPSNTNITIEYSINNFKRHTLLIHNVLGQLVYEKTVTPLEQNKIKVDIRGYDTGIYFVSLVSKDKRITKELLVY